jgi:hypothetical protein
MSSKPGRYGNRGKGRGGRAAGGGTALIGKPNTELSTVRNLSSGRSGSPTIACPVCGAEVNLRVDGSVGSHRVGSSVRNSWPCAGAGVVPGA